MSEKAEIQNLSVMLDSVSIYKFKLFFLLTQFNKLLPDATCTSQIDDLRRTFAMNTNQTLLIMELNCVLSTSPFSSAIISEVYFSIYYEHFWSLNLVILGPSAPN